jgi:FtsZ-interacting cell division protein ZipA
LILLIEGVLISIVGVLIVGGIILLIVLILRKKRKHQKQYTENSSVNEQNITKTNTTLQQSNADNNYNLTEKPEQTKESQQHSSVELTNLFQRSQIAFSTLTVEKKIGTGSYGSVSWKMEYSSCCSQIL